MTVQKKFKCGGEVQALLDDAIMVICMMQI